MSSDHFFERKPIETPGTWAPYGELLAGIDIVGGLAAWCCPRRAKLGAGRRVLLLPGFATRPKALFALERVAEKLGFAVSDWGLGLNNGRVPELLPAFVANMKEAVAESEQPVVLIGWSLGGYIAREAARDYPELVEHVITLGTPVWGGPKYTTIHRFYRDNGIDMDEIEQGTIDRYRVPLTTPVTAFYAKRDGIVAWQACIDHWSPSVKHIEVGSTHLGMPFSRQILNGVANTLSAL